MGLSWTPDGQRIVFNTLDPPRDRVDRVWITDVAPCLSVCDPSPSELRVPVPAPCDCDYGYVFAGWSSDGTRLLLRVDEFHSGSILLDGLNTASVALDGSDAVILPVTLDKPSWIAPVPGTRDAVFDTGADRFWDSHRELDTCNLATGACQPSVVNPGPVIDPAVAPNGTRLAYVATDPLVFADPNSQPPASSERWSASRRLVVADINGQHPRVIIGGGVVQPRWATDSEHVIFWRAGYLFLVDTSHPADPVPVAGPADPGAFYFGPTYNNFEDYAYIVPGNDVWQITAWAQ
jgi:Tol biopolymer transport system component